MPSLAQIWTLGLFVYPFFFVTGVPFPYIYPKVILLTLWVGLGLVALSFKVEKDEEVRMGKAELGFWFLLLLSSISMFWSPDIPVALFGPFWRGTGIAFYLIILLIAILLGEKNIDREKIAKYTLFSGIAVSIIIFFTFLIGGRGEASKAMMGNPNALSLWVGVTALLNYHYSRVFKNRNLNYFFYLPIFASLIMLGSRSSIGGVILCFLAIGFLTHKRVLKFALGITGLITAGLLIDYFLRDHSILKNLIFRTSQFARLGIFKGAWDSYLVKPVLGYSTQGLIQGYWHNYTSWLGKGLEWNDNAHNIFLNIMAEIGTPGLLLFLITCFFIGKVVYQKEGRERACWVGMLGFLAIYSLFQPYYVDSTFLVIFLLYLLDESPKIRFSASNKVYRGGKIILGLGLIYLGAMQWHQLYTINQTRHEIVKFRKFRQVWKSVADQVPHLDVAGSILEINNQIKPIFSPRYQKIAHTRAPLASFMVDAYEDLLKKYEHRPRLLENYAVWLSRKGQFKEALSYLDKVLEGSDQVTRVYMAKATIYIHLRDYKKAKQLLLKVKELNPDYEKIDEHLAKFSRF